MLYELKKRLKKASFCGVDGTRTHYLLIANQMLYQMSYYPLIPVAVCLADLPDLRVQRYGFILTWSGIDFLNIFKYLYVA